MGSGYHPIITKQYIIHYGGIKKKTVRSPPLEGVKTLQERKNNHDKNNNKIIALYGSCGPAFRQGLDFETSLNKTLVL